MDWDSSAFSNNLFCGNPDPSWYMWRDLSQWGDEIERKGKPDRGLIQRQWMGLVPERVDHGHLFSSW